MSTEIPRDPRAVLDIYAILGRVAKLTRVKTDAALAEALGTSRQVLSGWKKRGTVPLDRLCELAVERNYSLDYILLGKEPEKATPEIAQHVFQEVWDALRSEDCQLSGQSEDLLIEQAILIYNQIVQIEDRRIRARMLQGSINLLNSMSFHAKAESVRAAAERHPERQDRDEAERFAQHLEQRAEEEERLKEVTPGGHTVHQRIEGNGHQVAGRDFQNHGDQKGGRGGKR